MSRKTAFGIIPVPSEEVTKLLGSTNVVELLADHLQDFIQMSSFVDGLSYGFFANVPTDDYRVVSAVQLNILDSERRRFSSIDKAKPYTEFPVMVVQAGSTLTLLPFKPLNQTSWTDVEVLAEYVPLMGGVTLSELVSKFETPAQWVSAEMDALGGKRWVKTE
jgi:hypothetical protein